MGRSTVATQDFTGTVDTTPSGWEQLNVFTALLYLNGSGGFRVPYGSFGDARPNSGTYSNDQGASVEITTVGSAASNDAIGAIARASGDLHDGTDARDMYRAYVMTTATITLHLEKVVNGTVTSLGTDTSQTWVAGDRVEIECEGTTIRALRNGTTIISVTDASLTSGRPGATGVSAATLMVGDNWIGFDVTAGEAFVLVAEQPIALQGSIGISADVSVATTAELVASAPIALQGTLGITGDIVIEADIPIEQVGVVALQGSLTISAAIEIHVHRWRVPTNAPQGTQVHMIVFSGTSPDYSIHVQGTATVDADGFADLPKDGGNPGDKAFALVHNFDDDVNTTSIYGGPCIATIVDVG